MARKIEPVTPPNPAKAQALVKGVRNQIDKLDLQILKLINDRASAAGDVGKIKMENGEDIFSPAREEEVLANVLEAHSKYPNALDASTVRAVFREIMSGSRALQKLLKVTYLGPEYSYSHLAAIERFGQAVEFVPVGSITAVFEEVNRGHADFGVVPVENSTDGRIADTLDMFMRMPQMIICSEIRLQIHHNLMAKCEAKDIRRVYSKPQAISQCRNWLGKNTPHALLTEVSSTTTAAELAQREPGAAAVASRQAAVRYGLRILFEDIQDSADNETRFAVIGHQKTAKTGNDKTTLMFRIPHSPGSLADAIAVFKANKVNLAWIESFPSRIAKNEYIFFADFEGHIDDPKISKMLKAFHDECTEVTVLGSYPIAQISG